MSKSSPESQRRQRGGAPPSGPPARLDAGAHEQLWAAGVAAVGVNDVDAGAAVEGDQRTVRRPRRISRAAWVRFRTSSAVRTSRARCSRRSSCSSRSAQAVEPRWRRCSARSATRPAPRGPDRVDGDVPRAMVVGVGAKQTDRLPFLDTLPFADQDPPPPPAGRRDRPRHGLQLAATRGTDEEIGHRSADADVARAELPIGSGRTLTRATHLPSGLM